MRLIDADELRERMHAAGFYREALAYRFINAAPTVEPPEPGMTVPEILAALYRGEIVEFLSIVDGQWVSVSSRKVSWPNPEVRRPNVRIRPTPPKPDTELVPIHKVIGRTPVLHNIPVRTLQYRRNPDGWIWDGGGEHCGSRLTVTADGLVEVLVEGDA